VAPKTTPLISQYLRVKEKVPDAILFFRLGDFYEMFFEDAEVGARVLDIQLTSRSKDGAPLCGVPYHAADNYIAKLLKAGFKVAICEQTANENHGKGLMPREIVRVMTPGTVNEELVLTADQKNYLAAVASSESTLALAALDVSSGEFKVAQCANTGSLKEELTRLSPREVIVPSAAPELGELLAGLGCHLTALNDTYFGAAESRVAFESRFGSTPHGWDESLVQAAGASLLYVEHTFGKELGHILAPELYRINEYLLIDEVSRSHLELIRSSDGAKQGSLLAILDETYTAMGARTLTSWLLYPLVDLEAIARRHDAVEELFESDLGGSIADSLKRIGDLERLVGRLGSMRASPRDLGKLAQALVAVESLKLALQNCASKSICDLASRLQSCPQVTAAINATLADDLPATTRDGNLIRPGFDPEVDELRQLSSSAREIIARVELRERERTRINSLKVRYNQVFGYYIEVTKAHLDRVPPDYERKQTLVSAERFTTAELKELERKILSAESGLKELELRLFIKLMRELIVHVPGLQTTARAVGEFDALTSLATVARSRRYVRPTMNSGAKLLIQDGRHPVLEAGFKQGEFVPNDLDVDPDQRQLLLITGPNMAGKSTYLRQIALIVIMAQMGGFVPAASANLGVVDRIFTRIGARDDLRRGESTFMVEMRETARLLQGLGPRSLLLLDEVGRGTSTFDGLAIAWALAEHLHDMTSAKVLFATHFQELTDLARERPRVKNLSVAVREWVGEVVFLHRVIEGAASRSYGIEVARLAGLPNTLISRARQILNNLEQGEFDDTGMPRLARAPGAHAPASQLTLFASAERQVIEELKLVDANRLTPIDAMNLLSRLAERLAKPNS
jgi:DNA mismatch repair protein MutS